jgi:hypothetical protein
VLAARHAVDDLRRAAGGDGAGASERLEQAAEGRRIRMSRRSTVPRSRSRPILNNSSPGQAVYEPFMGSGTTLIAAETTGRLCHAMELDPAYVDVAVHRWQAFTGQEAVLADDGATFAGIAARRKAAA